MTTRRTIDHDLNDLILLGPPEFRAEWRHWLAAQPEAKSIVKRLPPGAMGMLLTLGPEKKTILRLSHFAWQLLKVVAGGIGLTLAPVGPTTPASTAALLEGLYRLKDSLRSLDESAGEDCHFVALVAACDRAWMERSLPWPRRDAVLAEHQRVRAECPVDTCRFHAPGKGCGISDAQSHGVLDKLVSSGAAIGRGEGLCPAP